MAASKQAAETQVNQMADKTLTVQVPAGFHFNLNSDNDIYIGSNGNFAGAYGADAVAIVCKCAAQTLRGEMIFNTTGGMPYREAIWSGSPNALQFEAAFRARISKIDNVQEILSLETQIVDGVFQYAAVILTTFGEAFVNG